jgi:hypothetical protein
VFFDVFAKVSHTAGLNIPKQRAYVQEQHSWNYLLLALPSQLQTGFTAATDE